MTNEINEKVAEVMVEIHESVAKYLLGRVDQKYSRVVERLKKRLADTDSEVYDLRRRVKELEMPSETTGIQGGVDEAVDSEGGEVYYARIDGVIHHLWLDASGVLRSGRVVGGSGALMELVPDALTMDELREQNDLEPKLKEAFEEIDRERREALAEHIMKVVRQRKVYVVCAALEVAVRDAIDSFDWRPHRRKVAPEKDGC